VLFALFRFFSWNSSIPTAGFFGLRTISSFWDEIELGHFFLLLIEVLLGDTATKATDSSGAVGSEEHPVTKIRNIGKISSPRHEFVNLLT
jgi:hypothetical protein